MLLELSTDTETSITMHIPGIITGKLKQVWIELMQNKKSISSRLHLVSGLQ